MTVNLIPANKISTTVCVPGKALLFGEYAVMRGAPAVVMTLPTYQMVLELSLQRCEPGEAVHALTSRYLGRTVRIAHANLSDLLNQESESEERNLACYLSQFAESLSSVSLSAEVKEAFSPALGFGSSSALLSGFYLGLSQLFSKAPLHSSEGATEHSWQCLYDALMLLQGRGSGYDVAVQTWNSSRPDARLKSQLFSFKNVAMTSGRPTRTFTPRITPLEIPISEMRSFGCFVETGIRSHTRHVLQRIEKSARADSFYEAQRFFAEEFVAQPKLQRAKELCREAAKWAADADLLPDVDSLMKFVEACSANGIAWKTMGAGDGDCLWVLADRARVEALCRDLCTPEMVVRFAFEEL